MKKLMSFMLALAIVLTCLPALSAKAVTSEITIDFSTTAQRTGFSTQQQVWKNGDLTFTNDKAASTSNVADYPNASYAHVRLYKSSSATIECPNMVQITFVGAGGSTYKTPIGNTLTAEGYTPTIDGDKYTITFAEPVDSFSISSFTAQVRMSSIIVTALVGGGSEGGETPDPTPEETPGATPEPTPGEDDPSAPSCDLTVSFDDVAKRTQFDASIQVWEENGITVTNNKGNSTNDVADYVAPARFTRTPM